MLAPVPSSPEPAVALSVDWLLDALPGGVLVLSAEGRIVRLNQQAATWWGLPAGELQGQLLSHVPAANLPPELLLAWQSPLEVQLQTAAATYFLPRHQQWISCTSRHQQGYQVVHWQPCAPPALVGASAPEFTGELAECRSMFQVLDDGFCIIEVLFDAQDQPLDYRFLEINPAFERQTGLANVLGRCIREVQPLHEQRWFELFGQVALTSKPLRFEQEAARLSRWFDVFAFPVGEPARRCVAVLFRDNTSRKQVEDALRQSEEHFRVVANLVPDLLWTNAPGGATSWCNQRWLEYTGQSWEQVRGYGWVNAIHPADREESHRQFQAAMDAGQPLHLEHRIRSASGEYRWFLVQMHPFTQQQGQILQWVGAATDIHERTLVAEAIAAHKQQLEQQVAERTQALKDSQQLLHSVFEASVNSVTVLKAVRSAQGEIIDFEYVLSNQISRLYNNGANDPGTSYTGVHPGVRKTVLFERFRQVVETGQRIDVEVFYGHEDVNQWFRVVGVKLADGLVVMAENITDRISYEQAKARSLQLLQQAEDVSSMGSWEYHLTEGRLEWSAGMHRLYHWAPEVAATPQTYLHYALPESRATAERLVQQLLAGKGDFDETLRLRVHGAEKTVRVRAVLVTGAEGQPARLVGMDVDISERLQLEQENLRLRLTQQQALFAAVQQAREAERRRVAEGLHNGVGQLLYATKLRLRQLAAFTSQVPPEVGAAYQETSQLLGEAIRQIRGLSHELSPHILESFGLDTAFLDIGHKLSSPQLRLDCRSMLAEQEQAALAPALQLALYRMAQELAQNIVKHAPGATRATVRLDATPGNILLQAEDNGPGFSTNPAESTGLGLRSIRNQVELLGGTITVSLGEQGGARVQLRIPLTDQPVV